MAEIKEAYFDEKYLEDVEHVAELDLPWDKMEGKAVLISGASGMIGSCLTDVLMFRNRRYAMDCAICGIGRNLVMAEKRFSHYLKDKEFHFLSHDINIPLEDHFVERADYIIHLASNTHPLAYSSDPIGTITANVLGTNNLLSFAAKNKTLRFLLASSNEIYGENRGDTECFNENYCGYIDSNTLRAGYTESKRCAEALCQAYIRQFGVDSIIARLTRTYGPTMRGSDSKAISQFIKKGVAGEDIVLKSEGMQYYSYTYVSDAVSGLLTVLLSGKGGEAYNVADKASDIRLRDLAALIADNTGKKVVFETPDAAEKAGYSSVTKARLDGTKLSLLGWKPVYSIEEGVCRTLDILTHSQSL